MNAAAGFCHAGGIRGGQVIAVLDLHLALYGNFAVVFLVHLQGSLIVIHKNRSFLILFSDSSAPSARRIFIRKQYQVECWHFTVFSVPHFEKKRKGEKFRIVNQSAKSS